MSEELKPCPMCAWNRRVNHIVDATEKVPDHIVNVTDMIKAAQKESE